MKKLVLISSILLLGGCTQAQVDKMSVAKVVTSDFDGSQTISSQTMPAYVKEGWNLRGVSFGAHWVTSAKGYVAFDVEFNNATTNLNKLYLNIDGVISEHETLGKMTKFRNNGAYNTSTNSFIVPLSVANKILNSKNVKFKVTTLSDGAREGYLIEGDKVTPAAKSLINVIKQVQ